MFDQPKRNDPPNTTAHERRDLNIRGILIFFIALGGMMAFVLVVTSITLTVFSGRGPNLQFPPPDLANAPAPQLPPEPRLEAVPGEQLQKLRENEDKILNTYGWVDQKTGVVHIPIERAMELIVQRGLPVRPGNENFSDTGQQSPSYPSSGRMMEKYP